MNFFEAQDRARRNTFLLVVLFVAAVALTIAIIYIVLQVGFLFLGVTSAQDHAGGAAGAAAAFDSDQIFVINADKLLSTMIGVLMFISLGSLYKIIALSGGGGRIAESMGGRLLTHDTRNAGERRLLNIVEEMAIAAGAPMPDVYLLPDGNINAFAAGTTPTNAVIGVTRGAMQHLSREQMQGVMAHEFSHIMNGDMRLNIRIIAVIHGIMLLGYIGYFILRAVFYTGGGRSSGDSRADAFRLALPLIAITLIIAGFVGTFFGSWIRASISRQREYLADAAAVQYTRHPSGIAGALERIGQLSGDIKADYQTDASRNYQKRVATHLASQLEMSSELDGTASDSHAIEYSHMFFSNAVPSGFSNPFATHPPLKKRIARLMPGWHEDALINTAPVTPVEPVAERKKEEEKKPAPQLGGGRARADATAAYSGLFGGSGTAAIAAAAVVGQIGTLNIAAIKRAHEAVERIPSALANATEEPYAARALVYAMLIDKKNPDIRARQMAHLREHADTGVHDLTAGLLPEIAVLPLAAKLPLLQTALPALRLLSPQQYDLFLSNMGALISADEGVELFEWCLQAIIVHTLHDHFSHTKQAPPRGDKNEAMAYALSILARVGQNDPREAQAVFNSALQQAGLPMEFSAQDFNPQELYDSMQIVSHLPPKRKEKFARAAVVCVAHDNRVDINEATLLRAYFMIMDCPLPLLVAQSAEGE